MNHGNKQVKSVMTEVSWAVTRTKDTFYSERYHKLAARRGKKRALMAVGHSILKSVWCILSAKTHYNELGAGYLRNRTASNQVKYYKKQLQSLGYDVHLDKVETQQMIV